MRTIIIVLINLFLLWMIPSGIWDYFRQHQVLLDEENTQMVLMSDRYLVEQKSILNLYVTSDSADILYLTEDDIAVHGFDADISYYTYGYGTEYYCSIDFSNITDHADGEKKTIEIGGAVPVGAGEFDAGVVLEPKIAFVSVEELVSVSMRAVIFVNVILAFLTVFSLGMDLAREILLWCNILVMGGVTYVCSMYAAQFGPDDKSFFLILSLMLLGYVHHLFWAKMILGTVGYRCMLAVIGLGSVLCLSNLFTSYYLKFDTIYDTIAYKNTILPLWEWERELSFESCCGLRRQLAYWEFSFRYFFSLPEDESYGVISIAQFMIGKLYEVIMIGSIGGLILRCIRRKRGAKGNPGSAESDERSQ